MCYVQNDENLEMCVNIMCANISFSIFIHFVLHFPGLNNCRRMKTWQVTVTKKRDFACSRDWRQLKHPWHMGFTTCYTYSKVKVYTVVSSPKYSYFFLWYSITFFDVSFKLHNMKFPKFDLMIKDLNC